MTELTIEQKLQKIINYYKSTNELVIAELYEKKLKDWQDFCFVDENHFEMSKGNIQNKIINDKILDEKRLLRESINIDYNDLFNNNVDS